MIITTTPNIEGRPVKEYLGIVSGEVIAGVNFAKDFVAGISNFLGGRVGTYEDEVIEARQEALDEMEKSADSLGADAVIGVDIDYEVLNGNMLMVSASGTAVRL